MRESDSSEFEEILDNAKIFYKDEGDEKGRIWYTVDLSGLSLLEQMSRSGG